MENITEMTLVELRNLAKENNIKNISKLKKEELIQILEKIIETDEIEKETKINTNIDDSSNSTSELNGY